MATTNINDENIEAEALAARAAQMQPEFAVVTGGKTLYLTFTGLIDDAPVAQLIQTVEAVIAQEGVNHLYLALNTPGGAVSAGIYLYHQLKALPIKVTTHNIGQVHSTP